MVQALKHALMRLMARWTTHTNASADALEDANPLMQYFAKSKSGRMVNKWEHYFDIYDRHLRRFRGTDITLIEIGIFNGGSLQMWRDYLGRDATVVGVDTNPECARFAERGIHVAIGDQEDRTFLRTVAARYRNLAIVVDDGGHKMSQQITTLEELYPRLSPDGIYICEDTHTSYMPLFGGGYQQPNTFINVAKGLVDRLHAFHSQEPSRFGPDDFTRTADSVHFYHSMVVIEKKPHAPPQEVSYGGRGELRYVAPSVSGR